MKKIGIAVRLTIITAIGISIGVWIYSNNTRATASFEDGTGIPYTYGSDDITSLALTSDDATLYAACFQDGYIAEISCSTMGVLRTFSVNYPDVIVLSMDENYLYVTSGWFPGYLDRIRLLDGAIDSIELQGSLIDIVMDPESSRLWVIHCSWPSESDFLTDPDLDAPANTGIISEIDLTSFTIAQQLTIPSVPTSGFYSQYAERLFVAHALSQYEADQIPSGDPNDPQDFGYYEQVSAQWDRITVYDVSTLGDIQVIPNEIQAGSHVYECFNPNLEFWTDNGSKMAVPNALPYQPSFSMRVVDCSNLSSFDLTFPDANNKAIGCYFIHKAKDNIMLWASSGSGDTLAGADESPGNILVRVSTTYPYDSQAYIIDEVHSRLTDFAINSNNSTLYLTSEDSGQILVWTPDNQFPICSLSVSPTTYQGPAPAEMHFDASASYDPDQGDTLTFSWDFNGDATFGDPYDSGTDSQPVKNYYSDYTGPVTVRVTDNYGAHSDCAVQISIDIT